MNFEKQLEIVEKHYEQIGLKIVIKNAFQYGKYQVVLVQPFNKYGYKLALEWVVFDGETPIGSTIRKDGIDTLIQMYEKEINIHGVKITFDSDSKESGV